MSRLECGLSFKALAISAAALSTGTFFSLHLKKLLGKPDVFCHMFGFIPLLIAFVTYGEPSLSDHKRHDAERPKEHTEGTNG